MCDPASLVQVVGILAFSLSFVPGDADEGRGGGDGWSVLASFVSGKEYSLLSVFFQAAEAVATVRVGVCTAPVFQQKTPGAWLYFLSPRSGRHPRMPLKNKINTIKLKWRLFFPLCKPNKNRTEPLTQMHVPVYDGVCVGVLPHSAAPSLSFVYHSGDVEYAVAETCLCTLKFAKSLFCQVCILTASVS